MRRVAGLAMMVGALAALWLRPKVESAKPMPGAAVFQEKGCPQCHGPAGLGTEKGPSLAGVGKRLDRTRIERQISEGGGAMPAFGDVLAPEEITDLSAWLHTWKSASKKARGN